MPEQYIPEKSIVLVLDVSGSMTTGIGGGKTRMQVLKESTVAFIDKMAGTKSRICVVAYATNANTLTDFRDMRVPSDVAFLRNYVNNLSAGGSTDIGDGTRRAYWRLKNNASANSMKYAVVMTDGEPNIFTGITSGSLAPLKMDDGNAQYTGSGAARSLQYATLFGELLAADNITSYFIGLLATHSTNLEAIAVSAGAAEAPPGKHYYQVVTAEEVAAVYNETMYDAIALRLPMTVTFNEVFPLGVEVNSVPQGLSITVLPDGRHTVSGTIPNMGLDKNPATGNYAISPWDGAVSVTYKSPGVKQYNGLQGAYTDPFGNNKAAQILNTPSLMAIDTTPPSVPSGLTLTANNGTLVSFNWTASTDYVGVTGYEVLRNEELIGLTAATSFQDTSVAQNVTYSYTVKAFDASGNKSLVSAPLVVLTPDVTPPSVPHDLTVTAKASTMISLSWSASSDNVGVTGYRLYRNEVLHKTVAGTSYTDAGLATGVHYSYSVSAIDAAGNESVKSNAVTAKTNSPPIANAGADVTVEATSQAGRVVTLDGSGSHDPDEDPLTYTWTGAFGSISGMRPEIQAPPGVTTVTLTVSDGDLTSQDTVKVTVVDTTPPALTVPDGVTIEATALLTPVNLGQATVIDIFPVEITNDALPGGFALGSTVVTWTATDTSGNKATGTQTVTLVDTTPPVMTRRRRSHSH